MGTCGSSKNTNSNNTNKHEIKRTGTEFTGK